MYDQFRSPARPSAPASPLPDDYLAAMKRTPRGLATLERLTAFDRPDFKKEFEVVLQAKALPSGDHGRTGPAAKGILTTISLYNQNAEDRMYQWKAQEMINIVGVHEAVHIVIAGSNADSDGCLCIFCDCHERAMFQEMVARLQYSLVNPGSSTGKGSWLGGYRRYFTQVALMRADPKMKRHFDHLAALQDPAAFQTEADWVRKDEKKWLSAHAEDAKDTSPSEPMIAEAYRLALADMEAAATIFARDGAPDDMATFKAVINDMATYRADTKLALIP